MELLDKHEAPIKKVLPRDVATRWNSAIALIDYTVLVRDVYNAITDDRSHKLKANTLVKEEWQVLSDLAPLLRGILILTDIFSQSAVPRIYEVSPFSLSSPAVLTLVSQVIPAIDKIQAALDITRDARAMHSTVRMAAHAADAK
jgi:hypothetical protein